MNYLEYQRRARLSRGLKAGEGIVYMDWDAGRRRLAIVREVGDEAITVERLAVRPEDRTRHTVCLGDVLGDIVGGRYSKGTAASQQAIAGERMAEREAEQRLASAMSAVG